MSYVPDPRLVSAYRLGLAEPVGRGYYGRHAAGAGPRIVDVLPVLTLAPRAESGIPAWLKWVGVSTVAVLGAYALYQTDKSTKRSKDVRFGFDSEVETAVELGEIGAEVELSPGSRGAIDVHARWARSRWAIQQKASRRGRARMPRPGERLRLIRAAKRRDARPIISLREGRRPAQYFDARTLAPVDPPRR